MRLINGLLIVSIFFGACTQNDTDIGQGNQRADSLSIKLNSPELKAINARILEDPGNPELYNERAQVYLKLRELQEAVNDASRAIRLDSLQAPFYLTLADAHFAQNSTRKAKELLERAVVKFPDNTEALLKLAELYYLVQRYQEAIDFVNKALRINENLAKAYFIKGSIYRESGDTSRAISSLETAIEQDSRMTDAHYDLGVIYTARKNPLAMEYYNNVLRIDPSHSQAQYGRAKLLQDLGKTEEALREYESVLKADNSCANCAYNMGAIYLQIKKEPKKALEHFSKAISINHGFVQAYLARAYTYAQLNNKAAAKADYNMCLQLQPNYEPAIQGLNEL